MSLLRLFDYFSTFLYLFVCSWEKYKHKAVEQRRTFVVRAHTCDFGLLVSCTVPPLLRVVVAVWYKCHCHYLTSDHVDYMECNRAWEQDH